RGSKAYSIRWFSAFSGTARCSRKPRSRIDGSSPPLFLSAGASLRTPSSDSENFRPMSERRNERAQERNVVLTCLAPGYSPGYTRSAPHHLSLETSPGQRPTARERRGSLLGRSELAYLVIE